MELTAWIFTLCLIPFQEYVMLGKNQARWEVIVGTGEMKKGDPDEVIIKV